MIGKGPLLQQVKSYSDNYSNVSVFDYISNERLFTDFYSRAKVLIHPAIKDPIGFTVIEALSTSTPVLASSYCGASVFYPNSYSISMSI